VVCFGTLYHGLSCYDTRYTSECDRYGRGNLSCSQPRLSWPSCVQPYLLLARMSWVLRPARLAFTPYRAVKPWTYTSTTVWMIIGWWNIDAVMHYSRRQVKEFSSGVASEIIYSPEFFMIPQEVPSKDSRTMNHQHNFSAQTIIVQHSRTSFCPALRVPLPLSVVTRCGPIFCEIR
jgi:hypothetical protein